MSTLTFNYTIQQNARSGFVYPSDVSLIEMQLRCQACVLRGYSWIQRKTCFDWKQNLTFAASWRASKMYTAGSVDAANRTASPPPPQNSEEPFEIFSTENVSTGKTAPRRLVHQQGLLHRSVQVFLFNGNGEVLLQQRHPKKDTAPGCWDLSCAEHLQPGESYAEAAVRGLHEELGVPLSHDAQVRRKLSAFLQTNTYPSIGAIDREFVECYFASYSGPIQIDGLEVVDHKWIDAANVVAFIRENPTVTPWFADTAARLEAAFPQTFSPLES
eukprot:m.546184 g.546184  ORF g.546184 m.546184 type:complete len:272 (+) comp22150_c0_seq4:352-1167(+)